MKKLHYNHTQNGLIRRIYFDQKSACNVRNSPQPTYTIVELIQWFYNQPNFLTLYKNWVDSGFAKNLRPSVDRLDDYISYTLDNIQLVTWRENNLKSHSDRISGRNTKQSKTVLQLDKITGELIGEFYSTRDAATQTIGMDKRNSIQDCARGVQNTAYGFKWRYKDE